MWAFTVDEQHHSSMTINVVVLMVTLPRGLIKMKVSQSLWWPQEGTFTSGSLKKSEISVHHVRITIHVEKIISFVPFFSHTRRYITLIIPVYTLEDIIINQRRTDQYHTDIGTQWWIKTQTAHRYWSEMHLSLYCLSGIHTPSHLTHQHSFQHHVAFWGQWRNSTSIPRIWVGLM